MKIHKAPGVVATFVEVLGLDDTLRLLEAHGGTKIWIPKGIGNSSDAVREKLEEQFGKPMVRTLIQTFGGGPLEVPLCREWRLAIYLDRGLTQAQIARKLGCHTRSVTRGVARARGQIVQSAFDF